MSRSGSLRPNDHAETPFPEVPLARSRQAGCRGAPPRAADGSDAAGLRLYLAEVSHLDPPRGRDDARLLGRMRRGDRAALDEMALRHLGLVAEVVQQECRNEAECLEMLEEGNQALLQAIVSYSKEKAGGDFRRHTRSFIRRAIGGAARGKTSLALEAPPASRRRPS
jgi:DNA-directed RNA polymerase sigma subunit (sigma70/sigma32)